MAHFLRDDIDTVIGAEPRFVHQRGVAVTRGQGLHGSGFAVSDLRDAERLLSPLLGAGVAGVPFAIALLAAGQSSSITGHWRVTL